MVVPYWLILWLHQFIFPPAVHKVHLFMHPCPHMSFNFMIVSHSDWDGTVARGEMFNFLVCSCYSTKQIPHSGASSAPVTQICRDFTLKPTLALCHMLCPILECPLFDCRITGKWILPVRDGHFFTVLTWAWSHRNIPFPRGILEIARGLFYFEDIFEDILVFMHKGLSYTPTTERNLFSRVGLLHHLLDVFVLYLQEGNVERREQG